MEINFYWKGSSKRNANGRRRGITLNKHLEKRVAKAFKRMNIISNIGRQEKSNSILSVQHSKRTANKRTNPTDHQDLKLFQVNELTIKTY
ncbi:hypothetical protein M3Y96_00952700 [Aphelenchoides besseyi]|nr:hypothetical protein M3Y96_00952700 [Aphelenchoides besseyi]